MIFTSVIGIGLKFGSIYIFWQNRCNHEVSKKNRNQLMVNFARSRFELEKLIPKSWTTVYGNQNIQK